MNEDELRQISEKVTKFFSEVRVTVPPYVPMTLERQPDRKLVATLRLPNGPAEVEIQTQRGKVTCWYPSTCTTVKWRLKGHRRWNRYFVMPPDRGHETYSDEEELWLRSVEDSAEEIVSDLLNEREPTIKGEKGDWRE